MTRGVGKYPEEVSVPMTAQMYQFLELLAKRERASKADLIRRAIRDHLDEQEDVMGSRSRVGSRIVRQLEQMQREFLQQHLHASALQLAAIILLQMKQGAQGSEVLDQIAELAAHAGDEIKAVLKAKA
jgi:Arc/MetJ-type ribon-helix-helix transcriptional regulator